MIEKHFFIMYWDLFFVDIALICRHWTLEAKDLDL